MKLLIESISKQLDKHFEKTFFDNLVKDLNIKRNPLRLGHFAVGLRELTRHIFKRLAPDEEVKKCKWYIEETKEKKHDSEAIIALIKEARQKKRISSGEIRSQVLGALKKANSLTRSQRVLFAVKGGLSDSFIISKLKINLPKINKELLKAVDELSKFTHIEEDHFHIDESQQDSFVMESLKAISRFFEVINNCRTKIVKSLEKEISKQIDEASVANVIDDIDILATHYSVEFVNIDEIFIEKIDHKYVYVEVNGAINVNLQYGSDSDYESGDGLRTGCSLPYTCKLRQDIANPLDIEITTEDISVDNSQRFE